MSTITITIATETCGHNTAADNQRFAAAVKSAVEEKFPEESVEVSLSDRLSSSVIAVADEEVRERVDDIMQRVWDRADY